MNRFIPRRSMSIKSFYPKCINCINFNIENRTCKKFLLSKNNYIDYDSSGHEFAVDVRRDGTRCGEAGKLFDIGEENMNNESRKILDNFFFTSFLTGGTCFLADAGAITLLPLSLNIFFLGLFFGHTKLCQGRINDDKKRIEELNRFKE